MSAQLSTGRRRLLDAALSLATKSRSLSALGLREVTRKASLNPNTFYRHFKDFDALGLALVEEFATGLRESISASRHRAATGRVGLERTRAVLADSVKHFFDLVEETPGVFLFGGRELHGSSRPVRRALREVIDGAAKDMAADLALLDVLPGVSPEGIRAASAQVAEWLFLSSLDYLDADADRRKVRASALTFVRLTYAGAALIFAEAG